MYRGEAAILRTAILNKPLKELYLTLAGWEMKHLDQLEKAYDFAREEWWQRQGFSPA